MKFKSVFVTFDFILKFPVKLQVVMFMGVPPTIFVFDVKLIFTVSLAVGLKFEKLTSM